MVDMTIQVLEFIESCKNRRTFEQRRIMSELEWRWHTLLELTSYDEIFGEAVSCCEVGWRCLQEYAEDWLKWHDDGDDEDKELRETSSFIWNTWQKEIDWAIIVQELFSQDILQENKS